MASKQKAVVLYSGGLDSTVALEWAREKFGKRNVHPLFVYYNQKSVNKELASISQSRTKHVKHSAFYAGMDYGLLQHSKKDPRIVGNHILPGRNTVLMMEAFSVCMRLGYSNIVVGFQNDPVEFKKAKKLFGKEKVTLTDTGIPFIEDMQNLASAYLGLNVTIHAPLVDKNKYEVLKLAREYKVDVEKTWSCFLGGEKPCGACLACQSLSRALKQEKADASKSTRTK